MQQRNSVLVHSALVTDMTDRQDKSMVRSCVDGPDDPNDTDTSAIEEGRPI